MRLRGVGAGERAGGSEVVGLAHDRLRGGGSHAPGKSCLCEFPVFYNEFLKPSEFPRVICKELARISQRNGCDLHAVVAADLTKLFQRTADLNEATGLRIRVR